MTRIDAGLKQCIKITQLIQTRYSVNTLNNHTVKPLGL
jgi:hypothetical protein